MPDNDIPAKRKPTLKRRVKLAVQAVQGAGLQVSMISFKADDEVVIVPGAPPPVATSPTTPLDEWMAKRARAT